MTTRSSCLVRSAAPGARRARGDESGFSVVEMTVALAIFAIVSLVFASQLVGNYRAYTLTGDRSAGEQIASEAIENGRNLDYSALGTTPGNPPGAIPRDAVKTVGGVTYNVTTTVQLVDDPIPGGYRTSANYKRMEVQVSRDGKVVADMVTVVAPPVRASLTRGTIKVLTSDYANNTAIAGATINLTGGPSPDRTDFSDSGGHAVFADLTPTDAGHPKYSVAASAAGYSVLPEDVAPAPSAQTSLLASQTYSTTIRLFKTVTVTVNLVKPDGTPFLYPSTLSISSSRGSSSKAVTGGSLAFTTVGSEPVIPSVTYTLTATSSVAGIPVQGNTVTHTVPNNYPSDPTSTFTVVMPLPPPTNVTVSVVKPGNSPAPGIPVLITGGDENITQSGTTGAGGTVVIPLTPSVLPYTVALPTQNQSVTVQVAAVPLTVPFTLVTPSVKFVFRDGAGAPVPGVIFLVTGGDDGAPHPGLSDANGEFRITLAESTTAYNLNVVTGPAQSLKFRVTGTSDYLVFMTTGIEVNLKAAGGGGVLANMDVQITGGDLNATLSGVTESNGRLTLNVAPSATPYTLTIPAQQGYVLTTQSIVVDNTGPVFKLDVVHS